MLKRKEQEKRVGPLGRDIMRDLRDALLDGYMSERSFNKWYDRWLVATSQKDRTSNQSPETASSSRERAIRLTLFPVPELLKIRAHIDLIYQDNKSHGDSKSHVSRHSTYPPSSSSYGRTSQRGRARSLDRRHSSRVPSPVYTVEEYEEERRRPSYVDTKKAQSDWYHSHTLPSPYSQGALEYTPEAEAFEETDKDGHGRSRRRHHDRHTGSQRGESGSNSNSTFDRGRTRSRSVRTEKRVTETTTSDADSEGGSRYTSKRRETYVPDYELRSGGRSKYEPSRGR